MAEVLKLGLPTMRKSFGTLREHDCKVKSGMMAYLGLIELVPQFIERRALLFLFLRQSLSRFRKLIYPGLEPSG